MQFTDTSYSNTFNVDLPNGLYRVTVTLGDTTRTSIAAEGVLQIINMTGNNARDTILIPITDGQLNIMATDGKAGYAHTMSALDIEWVSSDSCHLLYGSVVTQPFAIIILRTSVQSRLGQVLTSILTLLNGRCIIWLQVGSMQQGL